MRTAAVSRYDQDPTRVARAAGAAMVAALLSVVLGSTLAAAAVGCSLNDPDRDVMRIFPDATSYRTEFVNINDRGGEPLAARLETVLEDELDPVFEALDVDYAYYTVLAGSDFIGRIHGVNQKGMYGGMQLILATDPSRVIVAFYYQKLSSPESARFRNEAFTSRFVGLSLDDIVVLRTAEGARREDARLTASAADKPTIEDPSEESAEDFRATLRGITKNLLLLRAFFPIEEPTEQDNQGGAR